MATLKDVQKKWKDDLKGQVTVFAQADHLDSGKSTTIRFSNSIDSNNDVDLINNAKSTAQPVSVTSGICHTICKKWVEGRITQSPRQGDNAAKWLFCESILAPIKGQQSVGEFDTTINHGSTSPVQTFEGGVPAKKDQTGGLNGHDSYCQFFLNGQCIGIFSFWQGSYSGKGHSIAVDSRSDNFYLFDPNSGQYWMHGKQPSRQELHAWWIEHWQVMNYNSLAPGPKRWDIYA